MLKSDAKRALILKNAKQVFIKNGFHNVTMKDIIEECGISRGGVYLYFTSVDEIFKEVIKEHNQTKLESVKMAIQETSDFHELVNSFFDSQKERLLHMENSLMLAQYEFFFAHKTEYSTDYFFSAFQNSKSMVYEVLKFGAKKGCLHENAVDALSDNIMLVLEGLGTLAMSCGVSEEMLTRQFDFIKHVIFLQKESVQQ